MESILKQKGHCESCLGQFSFNASPGLRLNLFLEQVVGDSIKVKNSCTRPAPDPPSGH